MTSRDISVGWIFESRETGYQKNSFRGVVCVVRTICHRTNKLWTRYSEVNISTCEITHIILLNPQIVYHFSSQQKPKFRTLFVPLFSKNSPVRRWHLINRDFFFKPKTTPSRFPKHTSSQIQEKSVTVVEIRFKNRFIIPFKFSFFNFSSLPSAKV